MSKVYILKHDYNHSGDSERDAFLIKRQREAGIESILVDIKEIRLTEPLYFQSNFAIVSRIDYPLTDLIIPIISKKFQEAIQRTEKIQHVLHPVIMFDDTYLGDRFKNDGTLKDDVPRIEAFHALQLLEYVDCFDYDNSEYRMVRDTPRLIRKFVLKEPTNGFPAIFRISETPSSLFVSEKLKAEIELAEIKTCIFEEVEVTAYKDHDA